MTRDLPSGIATACAALGSVSGKLCLMAQFGFDSGTIGMWTGFGNIIYNGITFAGGGNLISYSPYQETLDLQANGLTMTLSGVDSDLIEIAENEPYQGRSCIVYLAEIVTPGTVDSVYPLFSGILDVMDTQDDPANSVIQVTVQNVLILLTKTKTRRYTDQDQKSRYPDDDGLSFIAALQDATITW